MFSIDLAAIIVNRLKQLWELCHGPVPRRWLSMDRKPSYFNNAGSTGTWGRRGKPVPIRERFVATRERYTICTGVPWDGLSANADEGLAANTAKPLPKFAVMFKGQKDGKIINHIRKHVDLLDFLLVQV